MKPLGEYFKKTLLSTQTQNHPIFVYENFMHRWLCFDNTYVQTIINKYAPHRPVLAYLPALCANLAISAPSNHDVVMLGAGGGAIYHFMNKHYPFADLSLVEHDKTIIEIAQKYFHIAHPILHADAQTYLTQMPTCSHLFIDIFVDNHLPPSIEKELFLALCFKKATYCASFNILTDNAVERYELIHKIRHIFNNQTLCLTMKKRNNIIVHAYSQPNYLDEITMLSNHHLIYAPQWHRQMGLFSMMR